MQIKTIAAFGLEIHQLPEIHCQVKAVLSSDYAGYERYHLRN